jgi:hypothetical protein
LTCSLQLHPSAVILTIASALLAWRRRMALSVAGVCCGAAIGLVTVVPYVAHAFRDPSVLPGQDGFIGHGLVTVIPILRGVLYWLRYPSFSYSRKFLDLDFSPLLGAAAPLLEYGLAILQHLLDPISVVIVAIANVYTVQRLRRGRHDRARLTMRWLRAYAATVFVAAVISFALTPTTVMSWQCLPMLHAAVLPLVLWAAVLLRTRLRRPVDIVVRAWFALSVVFGVAIAFGASVYRSGDRFPGEVPLREHVMLHEIGLSQQSNAALGVDDGMRSDVLTYP